jgi:hypothetical protein
MAVLSFFVGLRFVFPWVLQSLGFLTPADNRHYFLTLRSQDQSKSEKY